jgi:anti-sigma factor RsiW
MLPGEREVAGLRCVEVLAALSDYLDGTLPDTEVRRITAHVAGCHWCERFGGSFAAAIAGLRATLAEPEPVPADVTDRLKARLAQDAAR